MKAHPEIQRITDQRKAAGISQKALALEAGLSAPHLSDVERGVRFNVWASTVSKLRQALGRLLVEVHDEVVPRARGKVRKKKVFAGVAK